MIAPSPGAPRGDRMLLRASDVRRGDFVAIGSITTSTSRVVMSCAIPPEVVISTGDRASGDRDARAHLDEIGSAE
jgi:hypothetical protein